MSETPPPRRRDDGLPEAGLAGIDQLLEVMARLRDPVSGCPWDLEQSFETIAPYTIEEAYEVAEAIRQDDRVALRDELGDLLLQVVFHAQMAREDGSFDFDAVARGIADKMIRRHPNVFTDDDDSEARQLCAGADAVLGSTEGRRARGQGANAEGRTAQRAGRGGAGPPCPAARRKAAEARCPGGFRLAGSERPVFDKVLEEVAELREAAAATEARQDPEESAVADELGDLLFACVNLARHLDVEPEAALRAANAKFTARFQPSGGRAGGTQVATRQRSRSGRVGPVVGGGQGSRAPLICRYGTDRLG